VINKYLNDGKTRQAISLLIASFLSLYFEMLVVRWLGAEIRVFSYFKNLIILAAFLGLGIGFATSKREKTYWDWFIPLFLFYTLLVSLIGTVVGGVIFMPDSGEYFWTTQTQSQWISGLIFVLIVLVFFCFTLVLFVPAGQLVGRQMKGLPPIRAYIINLLGSLIGIWAFALVSYLRLSPWAWLIFGLLIALGFVGKSNDRFFFNVFCSVAIVVVLLLTQGQTQWSPYYRVDVVPLAEVEGVEIFPNHPEDAGYYLWVNQLVHMNILNLTPEYLEANPKYADIIQPRITIYNLPYQIVEPDNVLVVGAGSGNDVAAGLSNGVRQIDAVEIDPLIYEMASKYHPEEPYQSEFVDIYIDDARAYFEKTDQKYDLIVFGILDSQTLLSGMSGVRLDNFVYTVESIQAAKELLTEDGVIAVTFYAKRWWIVQRIGNILEEVFGEPPLQLSVGESAWVMYVSGYQGTAENLSSFCAGGACAVLDIVENDDIPLATDDWPYLYNEKRGIPLAYWVVLIVVVAFAWYSMRKVYPDIKGMNWHFFFLGGAFLLIEFKIITELALLFGSTWLVNAIAISVVLFMVLIANLIVDYSKEIDRKWLYLFLIITLLVSYLIPIEWLLNFDVGLRILVTLLVMGLPLFFAAAIFSVSLKEMQDVTEAFASNFFGSAVGGVLEYSAMAFGIKSLYLFGAVLYIASWISRPK
jgi:hypothetical protein